MYAAEKGIEGDAKYEKTGQWIREVEYTGSSVLQVINATLCPNQNDDALNGLDIR